MSSSTVGSNQSKKRSVIANVLIAMVFVVLVVFMLLPVIWLYINFSFNSIIEPKKPVIRLVSFSASNFNITNGVLTATWEAKMALENPNKVLQAHITGINTTVYYKQLVNGLGDGVKGRFTMGKKSNTTMIIKSSISKRDRQPQRWVVDEIEKERNGGSVSLGLWMRLVLKLTTGSLLIWHGYYRDIDVSCGVVKVVFAAGSTTGTLATGDTPMECSHYPSD